MWDGNVPLHEWKYTGAFPPKTSIETDGEIKEEKEPVENVVTWVYEDGSFVPCAKFIEDKQYSIVSDYLGTPTHSYDKAGNLVWERELDCYGVVRKVTGDKNFVPQLYQGQYVDEETGLAYNRFRYYDPESGGYISQYPIELEGKNPTLYGYIENTAKQIHLPGLFAKHSFPSWMTNRHSYQQHHIIPHSLRNRRCTHTIEHAYKILLRIHVAVSHKLIPRL